MRKILAFLPLGALAAPLLLATWLPGCAEEGGGEEAATVTPQPWTVVQPGKADDYFSNVAAEFEVSGTVRVELDEATAADPAARQAKIDRRLTGVALFATAYFTNKLENFFTNLSYGGFSAMARNRTVEAGDVVEVAPGQLDVRFTLDVAGPRNLPSIVPLLPGDPAHPTFELVLPRGFEADSEQVPRGQIRSFDPATYRGELERLTCALEPELEARDAYPEFAGLLADDRLDVTLWFGHDYNAARSDLREARDSFYELVNRMTGFTAPVERFEELTASSGPLTRTMTAGGRTVVVEVRIFHSDMFTQDRAAAHDLVLSELQQRDIFFYNGHAGPFYGFYLSDDPAHDVKFTEFASLALPDKQQIVIANGCQTYSQYADLFYDNEAKSEANLDVVTTVNFSYGEGMLGLLRNLIGVDKDGHHVAQSYGKIIREINAEFYNSYKSVFYGVHGIDANPKVHPYASLDKLGQPCTAAADCGDALGNVCLALTADSGPVCGAVALAQAACPEGSRLYPLAEGDTIVSYACLP